MSRKTLRASLYFLGAVTALYLLVTLSRGSGEEIPESGLAAALAAIDGQQLTRVQFTSPRDEILLVKEGDAWTANGYPADTTTIHRFLRAIDSAEVQEVAATNPTNHESMGVSADSAREMVTDAGITILFGKHTRRSRTGYVRLPGSDTVHVVHGDLRYTVGRNLFDFRDKVMLRVDTSAVATLRTTRDGVTTVYERSGSTRTVDGEEAESGTVRSEIRNILRSLEDLRASGFQPEDVEVPDGPERSLVAVDANGKELASVVMVEGKGNWVTRSPSTPYVLSTSRDSEPTGSPPNHPARADRKPRTRQEEPAMSQRHDYDAIVVGSGAGGGITAFILATSGLRVPHAGGRPGL